MESKKPLMYLFHPALSNCRPLNEAPFSSLLNLPQIALSYNALSPSEDPPTAIADSCFSPSKFHAALKTNGLGKTLLYNSKVESTQKILHETVRRSAPVGTLALADLQTTGRGRGTNTWTSPIGCCMFSFSSTFSDGSSLPFVQYLVSLAILRAANTKGLQIKWPNDIYTSDGLKVGGILCQSEYANGKFHVTTGVGINFDNKDPTTCVNEIRAKNGQERMTREEFVASFCNELEPMEEQFKKGGFMDYFSQEYLDNWLHSNQKVTVKGEEGTGDRVVVVKGLSPTGCLLAADSDRRECELYPDGNSFDFFSGLIMKKE